MEVVADRAEKFVAILVASEQIDVTVSRYAAGERGPDSHVHREHADCFRILEGSLVFGVADERVVAPAGTFLLVPPGVVHTFRNESDEDARFLNFHAPSGGFADYMRGRTPGFDSFDPPDDGGRPASDALVQEPGAGERLAFGPSEVRFVAQGTGWLSLTETTLAPGFPGPVPHLHRGFVDSFYVLEGVLRLRIGDEIVDAEAGTYRAALPGTVHTFSNPGDEPVRMLNVMAPGGFEQYLKEVAAEMLPGAPPDPAVMAQIAARHDFVPAAT